jgi:hypothetical protein
MTQRKLLIEIAAGLFLIGGLTLQAQEKGAWRAASSNARTITGDLVISDEKLTVNFLSFTMVRIRALDKAEISAGFPQSNGQGSASLYRMDIPAARQFLKKNSLCGAESTEWMATYVVGRTLQLAFFSGQKPPVFTLDGIANSSDLCGTYAYAK